MRKITFILVLGCSIIACNNSADDKRGNKDSGTSIIDADSVGTKDSSKMDHSMHQMAPLDSNGRKPRN